MKPETKAAREKMKEAVWENPKGPRRLAVAIIRSCIERVREDLRLLEREDLSAEFRRQVRRDLFRELRWLATDCRTSSSFRFLCEALDINATAIRRKIAAEVAWVCSRDFSIQEGFAPLADVLRPL